MSPELLVTLFVLLALTIPTAIGGVFLFRGTYYKSLPGRIKELEESDIRKEAALKRQNEELQMWKSVATQTPEIQKLLEFFERHESHADGRMDMIDTQHSEILSHILSIEGMLNRRDAQQ